MEPIDVVVDVKPRPRRHLRLRRIHPAEEARHREAMDGLGVYDAAWALAHVVSPNDVDRNQNRLMLFEKAVQGGPIPKLFPELEEELAHPGYNRIPVTILNADGVEEVARMRYLRSNASYRVVGPGWIRFAKESGISSGDRIHVYTCRRDDGADGERCLFFFKS